MGMLQAVIFDMDGVLIDTYHAHFESWAALCAEHGIPLDEAQFAPTFGRTTREIIGMLWSEPPDDAAIRALDNRKEALFRDIVARDFPAMDGARELLESLRATGLAVAIGSSGPPENVSLAAGELGEHFFDVIVHGRDVERGKPDPQVFLLAAKRLGVAPEHCVVIEDAAAGIQAARTAAMAVVALNSTGHTEKDFVEPAPDMIASSLRELSPEILRSLVG